MDEVLARERADRDHKLARTEELNRQTPSQHVEPSDLKAASIRHLPLSLDGDSEHHPRFFNPYPEELPLPEKENEKDLLEFPPDPKHILWDTRDMEIFFTNHFSNSWEYASDEYPDNPPPSGIYREIGDYKFGQLLESVGFNWYAVTVTEYPEGNYPHFKAMLESEAIGMIMTITDIMAARLRTRSLRSHIIAPMLVISLMGPRHARLYDFSRKNTESAQLITRYWLGGACGQTTIETMNCK
ncbi:hypothetical protein BO83DRAFT_396580 [Aspergillus eucalypticola CBS 122712]|uniref:Uncharacterized protein n=1 Tax=Aspergillus eucalypticola (strain CBS 122712 / IBT 29274) TaxID=1448314 RepID=A0A317W0K7_ASPEC|nr:uncharacterized protein BO83DRAFT_396580 [Aspergillus eucalypticola CBS 122712]PWY80184.1 hypothetical protein BO83DRAFT_396580 [Aspergillus eucalypticola CBS 122712]